MPRSSSFGATAIDVETGPAPLREAIDTEEPFRILILGDFSGRANRGICEPKLADRRPVSIDRDNFDEVMAQFAPELRIAVRDAHVTVRFTELDDFLPDRIFERGGLLQALRKTRAELSEARSGEGARSRIPEDEWSALLHDIVAPHLVPGAPAGQTELLAKVDGAIGDEMRAMLHHPDFQALESAWRAVHLLTRELETGPHLKLFLADISQAELAAGIDFAEDLGRAELYRIFAGAEWAVVAGNYVFDAARADFERLCRIAKIAHRVGAPFLSAISARVLGCSSLAETPDPDDWQSPLDPGHKRAWAALRRMPESAWLGLALPRFLLRLPYGKHTESTELFEFEEMPGAPEHESYLWGNPAFALACLLGQAFTQCGWDFQPGLVREIAGLPAHVYAEAGEARLKPCAEVLLTERAAERILDEGPMPLLSIRGSDAVPVARFQSIAEPAAPLAGRWT